VSVELAAARQRHRRVDLIARGLAIVALVGCAFLIAFGVAGALTGGAA
jgi:hypothetical protein